MIQMTTEDDKIDMLDESIRAIVWGFVDEWDIPMVSVAGILYNIAHDVMHEVKDRDEQ